MRELDVRRERANSARKNMQSLKFRSFFAGFEKSLESQANAEERNAAMQSIDKSCAKVLLIEGANQCTVVADAGKNDGFGAGERLRRIGTLRSHAKTLQGPLHACDVTCAVIEQGDLHRRPFVLGRTLRRRLSRETAKRSARANALN